MDHVAELARLREALAEEQRGRVRAEVLAEVASAANAARCLEDAAEVALAAAVERCGWAAGHLLVLPVADLACLLSTGVWRLAPGVDAEGLVLASAAASFGPGEGLPGRALERCAPGWMPDLGAGAPTARTGWAIEAGFASTAVFPVLVQGRVCAVLELFGLEPRVPSATIVSLFSEVCELLARVVERDSAQERLTFHAMHDVLTGLPNRALLRDRLEQAVARGERRGRPVCVLFLDLDDFKEINDGYGHSMGDHVLTAMSERIGRCVRRTDTIARHGQSTVARLGGDEFAIVLEDCDDASLVADRIAEALRRPVELDEQEIFLRVSVGGASSDVVGFDADALLRAADAAMYVAKGAGKGRFASFAPAMDAEVRRRLRRASDLRHAVDANELRLLFQPEVRIATGVVSSAEALVRWCHPTEGLVLPDAFLPIAEDTGLIVPVGEWVLREACRRAAAWAGSTGALRDAGVSVNVSPRQLADPGFVAAVHAALGEARLPAPRLCLELNERVLVETTAETGPTLAALRALGVRLAVDDFGTGYSSLSSLRSHTVDALKVDRSFVARLPEDDAGTIVLAVVRLAQSLGLDVVAEGVESVEQLDALLAYGCECAQGHLFTTPVEPADLERIAAGIEAFYAPPASLAG